MGLFVRDRDRGKLTGSGRLVNLARTAIDCNHHQTQRGCTSSLYCKDFNDAKDKEARDMRTGVSDS